MKYVSDLQQPYPRWVTFQVLLVFLVTSIYSWFACRETQAQPLDCMRTHPQLMTVFRPLGSVNRENSWRQIRMLIEAWCTFPGRLAGLRWGSAHPGTLELCGHESLHPCSCYVLDVLLGNILGSGIGKKRDMRYDNGWRGTDGTPDSFCIMWSAILDILRSQERIQVWFSILVTYAKLWSKFYLYNVERLWSELFWHLISLFQSMILRHIFWKTFLRVFFFNARRSLRNSTVWTSIAI